MTAALEIPTPRWFLPLLEPKRYKGAKGGRSAGKSHAFAELMVEEAVANPDMHFVCIREVQKSLKFSAKRTIEQKIRALGVTDLFDTTTNEIRRRGGQGVILFQGMQDHTADSIRSLEGFHRAWVEEAHSLSRVSLGMLLPTIREEGSEIWFSWNPHYPTDPVDRLMVGDQFDAEQTTTVHVTYRDNPFITEQSLKEAERHRRYQPETFNHVWLGDYVEISDAIIFSGHWKIAEFTPGKDWDGPYHGLDFGFAQDPTAAVRCWIHGERLFIEREAGGVRIELDDTTQCLRSEMPDIDKHVIRADNARPESISYLQRHGLPNVRPVKKGAGSVDDGIAHMKAYREIVIHPRCEATADEFRRYSYKVDNRSGDVLPVVVDAFNHYIDAIRYALEPMIRRTSGPLIGRA